MLKKAIATAMAVVMVLALAIPSFAASNDVAAATATTAQDKSGTYQADVKVSSGLKTPNMKIQFDRGSFIILNPYKLKHDNLGKFVKSLGTLAATDARSSEASSALYADASSDTIVSYPVKLQSLSECGIGVTASAAKAVMGGSGTTKPTLSNKWITETAGKTSAKSMFLYLDFESSDGTNLFTPYNASNVNQLALTEAGAASKAGSYMIVIPKYTGNSSEDGTATFEACSSDLKLYAGAQAANPSFRQVSNSSDSTVFFRIGGNIVTQPTAPWVAADKPTITVTFSFWPTGT